MAVSVKNISGNPAVPPFVTTTDVTLDSSYFEGGESLTAAQLGLASVDTAVCTVKNGSEAEATPIVSAWYDPAKALIHVNNSKTGKEAASAANVEKVVVRVWAFGKQRAK